MILMLGLILYLPFGDCFLQGNIKVSLSKAVLNYMSLNNQKNKSNLLTKGGEDSAAGFSLIELLVVISIIALLASVILVQVSNARRKSRDTNRIANIKQLQTALALYFDKQGNQYPPANRECDPSAGKYNGLELLKTAGIVSKMPTDPLFSASCYSYATPESAPFNSYHLGIALEDKNNGALGRDADKVDPSSNWDDNFDGTNAAAAGSQCDDTAGVPYGQPSNTETCYDFVP